MVEAYPAIAIQQFNHAPLSAAVAIGYYGGGDKASQRRAILPPGLEIKARPRPVWAINQLTIKMARPHVK